MDAVLPNPAIVTTNLTILGNFLGTDSTGLVPLPAAPVASSLSVRGAANLTFGGLAPGSGNILAAGAVGVNLYSAARTRE